MTWRHLNLFQHHCLITATVPRIHCQEHGVKQIEVPWVRKASKFTLLFEQAAMVLVREMPVLTTPWILEMTDKRLWCIVLHYVKTATDKLDLSALRADPTKTPVVFAVAGKGKQTLKDFKGHLIAHDGRAENVVEMVSDRSGACSSG